jgi:hypothetical protein
MRKAFILLILICITFFGSLACTYNGALRQDFHHQSGDFGGKLPLRIAVVADPTIKKDNFHTYSGDGFRQNIALYPGLINAAAAELTGVFEQVRVIDLPEQATAQELLAFVELPYGVIQRASFAKFPVYGYSLVLSIKDDGQNPVAQYKHSGEIRPSLTVAGGVAAFLTGVSFGLLSPITLPITSYSMGEQIREDLEDSLHETLQAISYDMRNDPRLLAYGSASN